MSGLRVPATETLRRQVFREVFPDLPQGAPVRGWRLHRSLGHDIEAWEATREPERRLVLKMRRAPVGDRPQWVERQEHAMATEHRVLTEVAPRISHQNPTTRCPRVLAYRPASGLLALEAVDGPTLDSVLFGLAPTRARRRVGRLLELCGEWLARFHELTRTGETGNPFEWMLEQFTLPAVQAVFDRAAEGPTWVGLCEVARGLHAAYPTFRVARCAVHKVFAPYHVLVSDGRIYVIDLEASCPGYPYEDLALFDAYYDMRLPWQTALAATRLPIVEQRRALLRGYARYAPAFQEADGLVLRLARLHSLIRLPLHWEGLRERASPKSWLRWRWWRRRFRAAYTEELPHLQHAARRGLAS
ncbi:MAG: phosphotransferase family protein [bacterium]